MRKDSRLVNSSVNLDYALYMCSFLLLALLPTDRLRLLYIHGISCALLLVTSEVVNSFLLLGVLHSAVHNLWPFLNHEGYDPKYESFYDVLLHLVMLQMCFKHISSRHNFSPYRKKFFQILSKIFLAGSFLNVVCSSMVNVYDTDISNFIFVQTSIFQAISTGYWTGTMLWYGRLHEEGFFWHWLLWMAVAVVNWVVYLLHEPLVGMSMKYRYVEAVFTNCVWIAAKNDFFLPKKSASP